MEGGKDNESNGTAKGTPSLPSPVVATFNLVSESAGLPAERRNDQDIQLQDTSIIVMGKQNGEDLDQDAQERMLKEDSAAKIAIEKEEKDEKATEVRISLWTSSRPL